jgi:NAD-dependent SIR2 family protein deacetylase
MYTYAINQIDPNPPLTDNLHPDIKSARSASQLFYSWHSVNSLVALFSADIFRQHFRQILHIIAGRYPPPSSIIPNTS